MTLQWKAEYETGEARVDRQHQHLFEYVAQLEKLIAEVRGGNPILQDDVNNLLVFLDTYVNVHFAYEELCFVMRKCPQAKKNHDAHSSLIKFYGDFYEKSQEGVTVEMLEDLGSALKTWLVNHIVQVDTNLRACYLH